MQKSLNYILLLCFLLFSTGMAGQRHYPPPKVDKRHYGAQPEGSLTLVGGLNVYFQNCGLVSRLTPVLTKGTEFAFNFRQMEDLLREQNLINFKTLINDDMPRISGIIVSGYFNTLSNLTENYDKTNDRKGKINMKQLFETHLKIGVNTDLESEIQNALNR